MTHSAKGSTAGTSLMLMTGEEDRLLRLLLRRACRLPKQHFQSINAKLREIIIVGRRIEKTSTSFDCTELPSEMNLSAQKYCCWIFRGFSQSRHSSPVKDKTLRQGSTSTSLQIMAFSWNGRMVVMARLGQALTQEFLERQNQSMQPMQTLFSRSTLQPEGNFPIKELPKDVWYLKSVAFIVFQSATTIFTKIWYKFRPPENCWRQLTKVGLMAWPFPFSTVRLRSMSALLNRSEKGLAEEVMTENCVYYLQLLRQISKIQQAGCSYLMRKQVREVRAVPSQRDTKELLDNRIDPSQVSDCTQPFSRYLH